MTASPFSPNRILMMFFALLMLLSSIAKPEDAKVVAGMDSDRLKTLLLAAMDQLKSEASKTCGSAVYHVPVLLSGGWSNGISEFEKREISIRGEECLKMIYSNGGVEVHEVINEKYAFAVARSKAGVFSIAGVQQKGVSDSDDLVIREKVNTARLYLLDAYSFYGRTVWGLVQDPGFKLTKIESFKNADEEVRVRVEFDYSPFNKPAVVNSIEDLTLEGSYLLFSPDDSWNLREYGRPISPRTMSKLKTHPDEQLGFTETTVSRYFGPDDGQLKQEQWVRCVKSSYEPIPKEDFFLSHYGFPEPNFNAKPMWPWIAAGLTIAVICIFVSRRLLRWSA